MLDVVHQMMLQRDWPYRAVSVILESHAGPTERFKLYGANAIQATDEVHNRTLDISFLNPVAVLNMARLGAGIFTGPRDVATIARPTAPRPARLRRLLPARIRQPRRPRRGAVPPQVLSPRLAGRRDALVDRRRPAQLRFQPRRHHGVGRLPIDDRRY